MYNPEPGPVWLCNLEWLIYSEPAPSPVEVIHLVSFFRPMIDRYLDSTCNIDQRERRSYTRRLIKMLELVCDWSELEARTQGTIQENCRVIYKRASGV